MPAACRVTVQYVDPTIPTYARFGRIELPGCRLGHDIASTPPSVPGESVVAFSPSA